MITVRPDETAQPEMMTAEPAAGQPQGGGADMMAAMGAMGAGAAMGEAEEAPAVAPEMGVAPETEEEEEEMDERLAYLKAVVETEKLIGDSSPSDWQKTFKKLLQANLARVPGQQNVSVRG